MSMISRKWPCLIFLLSGLTSTSLCGCASIAPDFDVPTDSRRVPSTKAIVQRIECELLELVRSDIPHPYEHRQTLLFYDYQVAMLLTLDVSNTGGLAPSFSFPFSTFSFSAAGQLSQSREDSLNINLFYSMRDLALNWRKRRMAETCPIIETNLAGDLGLRRSISAAIETNDANFKTDVAPGDVDPTGGEFSGSINFTVTKNLTDVGPTWTLSHFVGPGGLASVSQVNNDKLSFGFAEGKNSGKPVNTAVEIARTDTRSRAASALSQQIITDFGTQLSAIRNSGLGLR